MCQPIGIDNNAEVKKERITDQLKTPELREKLKSGKTTKPHTNPLFIIEIT